jgi:hypothetical protein
VSGNGGATGQDQRAIGNAQQAGKLHGQEALNGVAGKWAEDWNESPR